MDSLVDVANIAEKAFQTENTYDLFWRVDEFGQLDLQYCGGQP